MQQDNRVTGAGGETETRQQPREEKGKLQITYSVSAAALNANRLNETLHIKKYTLNKVIMMKNKRILRDTRNEKTKRKKKRRSKSGHHINNRKTEFQISDTRYNLRRQNSQDPCAPNDIAVKYKKQKL